MIQETKLKKVTNKNYKLKSTVKVIITKVIYLNKQFYSREC